MMKVLKCVYHPASRKKQAEQFVLQKLELICFGFFYNYLLLDKPFLENDIIAS